MDSKTTKHRNDDASRASLHGWISAFLASKPISTPRKIIEWQRWADVKLAAGWSVLDVKQRIADAWGEWAAGGFVDLAPMTPELHQALADVFRMAEAGATPAQCAVVYRSLSREHPIRRWLAAWAERWEAMGETWQEPPWLPDSPSC